MAGFRPYDGFRDPKFQVQPSAQTASVLRSPDLHICLYIHILYMYEKILYIYIYTHNYVCTYICAYIFVYIQTYVQKHTRQNGIPALRAPKSRGRPRGRGGGPAGRREAGSPARGPGATLEPEFPKIRIYGIYIYIYK